MLSVQCPGCWSITTATGAWAQAVQYRCCTPTGTASQHPPHLLSEAFLHLLPLSGVTLNGQQLLYLLLRQPTVHDINDHLHVTAHACIPGRGLQLQAWTALLNCTTHAGKGGTGCCCRWLCLLLNSALVPGTGAEAMGSAGRPAKPQWYLPQSPDASCPHVWPGGLCAPGSPLCPPPSARPWC
jgi:hypothetical protein